MFLPLPLVNIDDVATENTDGVLPISILHKKHAH